MTKNHVCRAPYFRIHISYHFNLWHTNVKWKSPGFFFFFSKLWFSRLFRAGKWAKIVQNDKKLCLSCFISQEQYIIWSPFMVHMYKTVLSLGGFSFFQNFDFWVVRGIKRADNGPKWQKFLSITPYTTETIHHMIFIYGTHMFCFVFSFFQSFNFLGC